METNPILNAALPAAIALLMCGIGLHLTLSDFRNIARHPRAVLVGLAGHYLLLPALGFGIAWLLNLPPALAIGLVLIAACPSGTMANTLTFLARGNVALGVSLSVVSALVSFVTIPALISLATDVFAGQAHAVRVPVRATVRHLAGVLLVPILMGMVIRARAPTVARRAGRWVSRFAVLLLVALILALLVSERASLPDALAQAGLAAMLLACAAIGGGYVLGRLARLSTRDVLTVSLEVGIQNAALAILVALSVLNSLPAAIPGAMYGLLMYVPALMVVAIGRRRRPAGELADETGTGLRDLT